jgi:hypothetical protein
MSKIVGAKELRHQPYWDCLIKGTPGAFTPRLNINNSPIRLFTAAAGGDISLTNMDGPGGTFPSDQTYRILAMRVWLYFQGCQVGAPMAVDSRYDFSMYHHATNQLFWQLEVAQKQAFTAPTQYFPYGGGLFGAIGNTTDVYFVNGNPQQSSIMKLARSIALPARQNFMVNCYVLALGATNFATDITSLTAGAVNVTFTIDGLHVRDIL